LQKTEVWGIFQAMKSLTEMILDQGLADRFIRASTLERLIEGSPERRYGLVNRAIKSGELVRLQRGLYVLADRYRMHPCHSFAVAQALVPGSYISLETAMAYHGWIPERVFTTASVVPGRKSRRYENEKLGGYSFHSLALQPGYFLELVNRVNVDGQMALVADPCRALMDLVCLKKVIWKGMGWLLEGLRIDFDLLGTITKEDIVRLELVYKHERMRSFLSSFRRELSID
jgi:predicted transcriptional regulator of viral defense system